MMCGVSLVKKPATVFGLPLNYIIIFIFYSINNIIKLKKGKIIKIINKVKKAKIRKIINKIKKEKITRKVGKYN